MMISNASWFDSAGRTSELANELTAAHVSRTSSGVTCAPLAAPDAAGPPTNAPADRCHLSCPAHPAPISKTPPLSVQSSWQSQATKGAT